MLPVFLLALAAQPDTAGLADSLSVWSSSETRVAAGAVLASGALLLVDRPVQEWVSGHRTPASRGWAAASKPFGDGRATVPVAGLLWWAGAGGRDPRLARASRDAIESWAISGLAVQSGKYLVHRSRPAESGSPYQVGGPSTSSSRLSFPSGHSTVAWAVLSSYAMEYSDDHPWLAAAFCSVAASTSLSRVHDGMHWSSDVVFAAGLGWLSTRIVRSWNANRDRLPVLEPVVGESSGLRLVWKL